MSQLDIDALTAQFFATFSEDAYQIIVDNQPAEDIDESRSWLCWSVAPGASQQSTLGESPRFKQLGTAYIKVCVPAGQGTKPANDVIAMAVVAFRKFRSPDGALRVYRTSISRQTGKDGAPYETTLAIFWESNRSSAF